ncbi:bacterial regulatory s, tetR family protein [Burkholderia cenocepacia]|uniref:Bacterial regulatory s, tetR family protein n=1 Tax=Burkholderia cenocepacia TaxID=95486 RepID=A0AAN0VNM9_9BURK|nr:bacterial regulatory s, tetR family protein [Burkholderia cenocepacia]
MPLPKDTSAKKESLKPATVRAGRPPNELAGAVDERILDAAYKVFMERGLNGASIDEIARLARAGKPTIYARFATKEALFAAVGMRNAARVTAHFGNYVTTGTTLEARLVSIGRDMLKQLLADEVIDFMRLSAAEARRVPELAHFGRNARERGASVALTALREAATPADIRRFPAFGPERIETTVKFYLDLVVGPLLMRALVGEGPKVLRAQIDAHVNSSVAFFLGGCAAVSRS